MKSHHRAACHEKNVQICRLPSWNFTVCEETHAKKLTILHRQIIEPVIFQRAVPKRHEKRFIVRDRSSPPLASFVSAECRRIDAEVLSYNCELAKFSLLLRLFASFPVMEHFFQHRVYPFNQVWYSRFCVLDDKGWQRIDWGVDIQIKSHTQDIEDLRKVDIITRVETQDAEESFDSYLGPLCSWLILT